MLKTIGNLIVVAILLFAVASLFRPTLRAEDRPGIGGCVMCPSLAKDCPDGKGTYTPCMSCTDKDCVKYGCSCEESGTPCGTDYPDLQNATSYDCYWMGSG